MRLRRKGRHWYLRVRRGGHDTEIATGCTDKKAAELFARNYERDTADPQGAARRRAADTTFGTLVDAEAGRHDAEVDAGRMAPATRDFYRKRLASLLGSFGVERSAADIDAAAVDAFIASRRADGAADHTIHKELGTLRRLLSAAARAGTWFGDERTVIPVRFSPDYTPRERWLSIDDVRDVLRELSPARGAWVALAAGAGAELAALERAERSDFDEARRIVLVRGTKNARRHREVPLTLPVCAELVARAFRDGDGDAPRLLRPWRMHWRDLQIAARRTGCRRTGCFDDPQRGRSCSRKECERAAVDSFSLHTLRHSFATWHLAAGASFDDVARIMGHAGTAMLHRVYGHLGAEELRARLASSLDGVLTGATSPDVPRDGAQSSHPAHGAHAPEARGNRGKEAVSRVPRDGIEPPTRGFSVPCSTN